MCKRTIRQVALLGSYLPRQCGIATFTHDVYQSLRAVRPEWDVAVVALNDDRGPYAYPPEVKFEIDQHVDSYHRAARYLNACEVDAIFIQHEYGLFGGDTGDMLFELLDTIRIPVVTMLHTILQEPNDDQFRVLRRLAARSANLITMSARGQQFLTGVYDVPDEKISVIPHGIPDMPFVDPVFYKEKFGWLGKQITLTFGLLSPGKGIEYAIQALPSVIAQHPNLLYVILGATHPNLVLTEGERYRESLQQLAEDCGVADHVQFINQFVDLDDLVEYISAADIYLTPYLNQAQITSGTLAYAYGCGNAVISTPYWHAVDLFKDGRGRIVPFRDSDAIAEQLFDLLGDDLSRHRMRKRAFLEGRQMVWPVVAEQMAARIEQAHNQMFAAIAIANPPSIDHNSDSERIFKDRANSLRKTSASDPGHLIDEMAKVLEIRLDYLFSMTDDVGLIQHATYNTPNLHEGYCTDDNVRGLLLTSMLRQIDADPAAVQWLDSRYRAFCNYAFHAEHGTIRNFMSYERRWLEDRGSDDCIGRVAWALGHCIGQASNLDIEAWAVGRFESALQQCLETTSPRSWSFGILGAAAYQRQFHGERFSRGTIFELAGRLTTCFDACADQGWIWFEEILAYDNARLSEAMIVAGALCENRKMSDIGFRSLRWLCDLQRAPEGHFRPIGNDGFFRRGSDVPAFDQQPLEAWATLSAALTAAHISGDESWNLEADLALAWFLGCNDLRVPIANVETGACHDGLQFDRVNRNQGAESTLAWLLSAVDWQLRRGRQFRDSKSVDRPIPSIPMPIREKFNSAFPTDA